MLVNIVLMFMIFQDNCFFIVKDDIQVTENLVWIYYIKLTRTRQYYDFTYNTYNNILNACKYNINDHDILGNIFFYIERGYKINKKSHLALIHENDIKQAIF